MGIYCCVSECDEATSYARLIFFSYARLTCGCAGSGCYSTEFQSHSRLSQALFRLFFGAFRMSAAQFIMLTVDTVTAFPSLPPHCPLRRIRNCARPGIPQGDSCSASLFKLCLCHSTPTSEQTLRISTAENGSGFSRGSQKGVQDRVVGPGPKS